MRRTNHFIWLVLKPHAQQILSLAAFMAKDYLRENAQRLWKTHPHTWRCDGTRAQEKDQLMTFEHASVR